MQKHLWPFARTFYSEPGVEKACLALQDQGANVCLMLCAAWLIKQNVAFNAPLAQALIQLANTQQQELIMPLRTLRMNWRARALTEPFVAQLREQIKQLELETERKLLEDLEALAKAWSYQKGCTDNWLMALSVPVTLKTNELAHWQQLIGEHSP